MAWFSRARQALMPAGVARDSALTLAAQVAGGALTILFLAIWSRSLSLPEFGVLSLALAVSNLLRPMLDLGINNALVQGMAYNRARGDSATASEVNAVASLARLVVTCLVIVLAWPAASVIAQEVYRDSNLTSSLALGIATGGILGARQHVESILRADRQFVWIASCNIARFAVPVLLSLPALWIRHPSIMWPLAANLASPLVFIGLATPIANFGALRRVRPAYRLVGKMLFSFAAWIALVRFLDISTQLDVPIIRYFLNPVDVAYYYAAYRVLDLFTTVGAAIGFVLLPHFSGFADDKERLQSVPASVLTRVASLAIPLGVALFFLMPLIVRVVWGSAYAPAIPVVWLLLPGAICALLAVGSGEILMAKRRPVLVVPQALINFVGNIALLLVLTPRYGIWGAAAATSITYALVLVAAWWIVAHEIRGAIDMSGPARVLGAGMLMAITTWLVTTAAPSAPVFAVVGAVGGLLIYITAVLIFFPKVRASSKRVWSDLRHGNA